MPGRAGSFSGPGSFHFASNLAFFFLSAAAAASILRFFLACFAAAAAAAASSSERFASGLADIGTNLLDEILVTASSNGLKTEGSAWRSARPPNWHCQEPGREGLHKRSGIQIGTEFWLYFCRCVTWQDSLVKIVKTLALAHSVRRSSMSWPFFCCYVNRRRHWLFPFVLAYCKAWRNSS
jgi:hypothetical protein